MKAKNPVRVDDARIDVEVAFDDVTFLPFTASANDPQDYGRDLYARVVAGEFGEIAPAPVKPVAPQGAPPSVIA